jgi:cyclophilin family peptidyl-prolyl cis-trans isomerase
MIPFFISVSRPDLGVFRNRLPSWNRTRHCLLASLVCVLGLSQSVAAMQGDPDKFANMRDEIRRLEREISKKYSSIPIGFPEEQEKALAEIETKKTQVAAMRKQLDLSAIESYTADPEANQIAASHILNMGLACVEGRSGERPFDPARAYELATLLGKGSPGGKPAPVVLNMAYQACLAMQDYERAERILKRIEGMGVQVPEKVATHLGKLKRNWAKELVKRESEQQRDDLPRVKLETDLGDIVVELFEDDCPATVANFISLVESGFYNGTAFYEVRPGLVARTGCPKGDGTGDPGYKIANESSSADSRRFFAGTLGMHHDGANTAGSQFFFTYQPKPDYDLNYVAFGRIVEGLEVLYQLPRVEPRISQFDVSDPRKIKLATVIRKRDHAYEPVKIQALPPANAEADKNPSAITDPVPAVDDGTAVPDVAPADVAPADDGG